MNNVLCVPPLIEKEYYIPDNYVTDQKVPVTIFLPSLGMRDIFLLSILVYNFLQLHLHQFSKIKSQKEVTKN
jgi:hypothetical protein